MNFMPETDSHTKFDTVDDLASFLRHNGSKMSKRLRECATYILEYRDQIAVSTVADIAAGAGVQPSAVIRFCKFCGFSGFSELQRLYRDEHTTGRPNYTTRLEQMRVAGPMSPNALLADFVDAGRTSLAGLFDTVDMDAMDQASTLISKAKMIHTTGFRRAFPVISYLTYMLEKMGIPTVQHTGVGGIDQLHAIRKGDVVLAVTYAPYSQETIKVTDHARSVGATVITITDIAPPATENPDDISLIVQEADIGAFRGLSASLTLATTLAICVGQMRDKNI